jgi:hypothetical protein
MPLSEELPPEASAPLYQSKRVDHQAVQLRQVQRALLAPLTPLPATTVGYRAEGGVIPTFNFNGFKTSPPTNTSSAIYASVPGTLTVAPGSAFVAAKPAPPAIPAVPPLPPDTGDYGYYFVTLTNPVVLTTRSNNTSTDFYGTVAIVIRDSALPNRSTSPDNWQVVDYTTTYERLSNAGIVITDIQAVVDSMRPADAAGWLPLCHYRIPVSSSFPTNVFDIRSFAPVMGILPVTDYRTLPRSALPGQLAWLQGSQDNYPSGMYVYVAQNWKFAGIFPSDVPLPPSSLPQSRSFKTILSMGVSPVNPTVEADAILFSDRTLSITVELPYNIPPAPLSQYVICLMDAGLPKFAEIPVPVTVHVSPPEPEPPQLAQALFSKYTIRQIVLPGMPASKEFRPSPATRLTFHLQLPPPPTRTNS